MFMRSRQCSFFSLEIFFRVTFPKKINIDVDTRAFVLRKKNKKRNCKILLEFISSVRITKTQFCSLLKKKFNFRLICFVFQRGSDQRVYVCLF